jgi:hypothetical protein
MSDVTTQSFWLARKIRKGVTCVKKDVKVPKFILKLFRFRFNLEFGDRFVG